MEPPCNDCGAPVDDWKPLPERVKVDDQGRVLSLSITPLCRACRGLRDAESELKGLRFHG